MLRKAFDLFIFSSLFIGGVAVMMVMETNHILSLTRNRNIYLLFVFFSTITSYNIHWLFTPLDATDKIRVFWTSRHLSLQRFLIIAGACGAAVCAFQLLEYGFWLGIAVVLTFLYTAPKLPLPFAPLLKKVAIGKTIFLASVWAYVTALLPVLISEESVNYQHFLFFLYRLFFLYSICIVFDYRDREEDRKDGIRSMITILSPKGIKWLFIFSALLAGMALVFLYISGISLTVCLLLLIPVLITTFLFDYAKKNRSDYFYYFILDGLMMASALFTPFLAI